MGEYGLVSYFCHKFGEEKALKFFDLALKFFDLQLRNHEIKVLNLKLKKKNETLYLAEIP